MIIQPQKPSIRVLLFSLKGSIIPAIWRKVLYTVLISSAVVATHGTLFEYKVILTATPFTLWGLTLAIFLGFATPWPTSVSGKRARYGASC